MLKHFYQVFEKALSPRLCDLLLSEVDWTNKLSAGVLEDPEQMKTVQDEKIRRTIIAFEPKTRPLGAILAAHIMAANRQAEWNFDINSVQDTQIGRYEVGNFYDWHIDTYIPDADGMQRKLSAILFLSDPDAYDGGELQLRVAGVLSFKPAKGTIIVFPSVLEHTVTPITEGTRYTAVSWATGPAFR